jgi:hypothetical protein
MATTEVSIRRKESQSHLPVEVRSAAKVRIGAHYVNRQPLRGLTEAEEKQFLPVIIGVSPTDVMFGQKTRDYWNDFTLDIPIDGKILNIAKTAEGSPLNLNDYIAYRWCLKHTEVADSREEMERDGTKRFYIHNPEKEISKENNLVKIRSSAYREFIKVMDSDAKMGQLLRLLGNINPDLLSTEQKQNRLEMLVKETPEDFLKYATDKDLAIRALIEDLVITNVLRKIGSQYIYIDQTIGETLDDAVNYFKNKRNSGAVNEMRAKYKEARGTVALDNEATTESED